MTAIELDAAQQRLDVGRRIRLARDERGISLRELARRVGVSPATVSAVENGKTGLRTERLTQIAAVLAVPVTTLLSVRPNAQPGPPHDRNPTVDLPGDWRVFPPLDLDPALGAALSAFVQFGYHGATMRDIAGRAGLSVPGIYHYYSSKQQMLVALLDRSMIELLTRSRAARADGHNPVERLALLVECLALFHTHRRELGFIGASEMRSIRPPDLHRIVAARVRQQRMVDTEIEAGTRAGAFATSLPHEAARAVVTMCTALPQWFSPGGPYSAEEVAAQYVRLALDLLGAEVRPIPTEPAKG